MNTVATRYIKITAARYLTNYKIEFEFDDQTKKVIDFEPFLNQAKISATQKVSQLSHRGYHQLANYLKAFPLTVSATLPINQAMVTD